MAWSHCFSLTCLSLSVLLQRVHRPSCRSVRCFRCCLPKPSPLLSCPPVPPAVAPPLRVRSLFSQWSFSKSWCKKVPCLVCICICSRRGGGVLRGGGGSNPPAVLRFHHDIPARHTRSLFEDPSLRALVCAKSRCYNAPYATNLAIFIGQNLVLVSSLFSWVFLSKTRLSESLLFSSSAQLSWLQLVLMSVFWLLSHIKTVTSCCHGNNL